MKEMLPFLIPTAFPTLMVMVGILLNQKSSDRLDARISGLEGRVDRMHDQHRSDFANLEGRIDRMRDQHHTDMMMILGRDNDLEVRLSKLEDKREK